MEARDFYLKVTNKDKSSHILQLRVWDADKKLASMQDQHAREGGKVEVSSEADYIKQRNKLKGMS